MGQLATMLRHSLATHADLPALELPAGGQSLTYRELHDGALRWAPLPGSEGRTVLAALGKSAAFYELSLAAYLFGWSWCPLDPGLPLQRLRTIADQFEACVIVSDDDATVAALGGAGYAVRSPDEALTTHDHAADHPDAAAAERYFIATSGTTGTPKLVEVAHDTTVAFVEWAIPFYEVTTETRWSQFSSIGFDLSIVDQLVCWVGGGTLVVVSTMAERARLHRFATDHRLTHWHSVPSIVTNLVRGGALPHLRVASFCGEPLLRATCSALRAAAPSARVVNTYGPTEGPLFCTHHEVTDDDLADPALTTMPIGRPNPGYSLLLEGPPDGDARRLVIAAERLAEGYLGLDDPAFGRRDIDGRRVRTFDTGDHVVTHGPHLCFSHRTDGQVKLAGVRIELGDVANACTVAGLSQPTVLLHRDQLVVFHEGLAASSGDLSEAQHTTVLAELRTLLPPVAVPTRFRFSATLPRTISGKVDRAALGRLLLDPAPVRDE